ncbi:MAG: thiamine-phosphate kinase [Methylophilaceae bacterium]|nr:thiamine-phosphate kinase [Methylophilaceae bacterium]
MTPEFNLIQQYFTRPAAQADLGVGDDAALISVTPGQQMAISADMLVAGTHFFADADPYQLGWKSLAVNISDMAAMGAQPKWATLAIALPEINERWLAEFSRGFFACAEKFNVDLIGGDTTRGPLTISVQIMGEVAAGKALQRAGAKIGDEIWVSGCLGDAALALAHTLSKFNLPEAEFASCAKALHTPQPRVSLGLALLGLANSAIDVSDGLLADLGHILQCSKVGAEIHLTNIPKSSIVSNYFSINAVRQMALVGGDDYELCFTAPYKAHAEISRLGEYLDIPLSVIGQITGNTGLVVRGFNHEILDFKETGFDHFA